MFFFQGRNRTIQTFKRIIIDCLGIALGAAITALALTVFLIPNKIAAGGISGLATVLYYLFEFRVGITMLVINIPILLTGMKILGATFGARTIYGIIMLSIFTELFQPIVPDITNDLLLASIYGGLLTGMGLGIVFKFRGTTGGTDMIARLIHHYSGFSVGQGLLIADGFVVTMAGIFFNLEVALYAAITIFITSKTIDVIQEGMDISKAALIISDQKEELENTILDELGRGVTSFQARGAYTDKDREVLLCIISRSEVTRLKSMVHEIDEDSFVIITAVHEVLGEGFQEVG